MGRPGGWQNKASFFCLFVCTCVRIRCDWCSFQYYAEKSLWDLEIEGRGEGDGEEFCCLGYSAWKGGRSRRGRWWGYFVKGRPVWLVLITQERPSCSDQQTAGKVAHSGFPKSSSCTDEAWGVFSAWHLKKKQYKLRTTWNTKHDSASNIKPACFLTYSYWKGVSCFIFPPKNILYLLRDNICSLLLLRK